MSDPKMCDVFNFFRSVFESVWIFCKKKLTSLKIMAPSVPVFYAYVPNFTFIRQLSTNKGYTEEEIYKI